MKSIFDGEELVVGFIQCVEELEVMLGVMFRGGVVS